MAWCNRLRKGHGISLLVPYRDDGSRRSATWEWLRKYWRHELPGAEVVIGHNGHVPFCKTMAVNYAFRRCHGDIVVILDADCYIPGDVILEAAKRIRKARRQGHKLWFVP
jgi:predicted glycosyltransferase involved in capsule biosynthesis